MPAINLDHLNDYRAATFRTRPGQRVTNKEEAIEFVNQRGYIYFWPIKDMQLPSLWAAVAGDRPVSDAHDDPGHVTWGWKDSLLGARRWYYAKVLRKRATLISLEVAPFFYALSENYGSPEEDYLTLYEQGRLTLETKLVFEALLLEGPLDTVALRRATHLTSRESDSRFNRALTELQADFKILPIGVTQSGRWRYAFAYDLVSRHYPDLPEQARFIQENQARLRLAELYFHSVGAARLSDLVKLFGWKQSQAERAVTALVQAGLVSQGLEIEKYPGEWIGLRDLIS